MPQYNEHLADRLREALADLPHIEEKIMFSGVSFLVNGKMCINVSHDELMCRVGRAEAEKCVEENGCRQMMMRGAQRASLSQSSRTAQGRPQFWKTEITATSMRGRSRSAT